MNHPKNQGEPMLDFDEIKKLVKLLERSQIHEIEIFDKGRKIRLAKSAPNDDHRGVFYPAPLMPSGTTAPPTLAANPPGAPAPAPETAVGRNVRQVRSPMVGTFYAASSPDAEPYVQVGDMVHKGQVLCIIEAMKLMNEIESEYAGRVVEIHVENAQPVEFDQPLFTIEVA
jgi:acetyl-CoA carboxylase biotin carboxyl carrier protein